MKIKISDALSIGKIGLEESKLNACGVSYFGIHFVKVYQISDDETGILSALAEESFKQEEF